MIIVFLVFRTWSWIKQKVTSNKFKNHTCIAPKISRSIVINSQNNLWSTILSSLNFRNKMIMSPASISKITNFTIYIFTNERTFDFKFLLFSKFCLFRVIFILILFLFILICLTIHQLHLSFFQLFFEHKIFLNFITKISFLLEYISTFFLFIF